MHFNPQMHKIVQLGTIWVIPDDFRIHNSAPIYLKTDSCVKCLKYIQR